MIRKVIFTSVLLSILMEGFAITHDGDWRNYDTVAERIETLQVSRSKLKSISTADLLQQCLDFPYNIDVLFYGCSLDGFNMLTKEFNGYAELFSRNDITPIIQEEMSKLTNKIERVQKSEKYNRGMVSIKSLILDFISLYDLAYNKMSASKRDIYESLILSNDSIKEIHPDIFGGIHNITRHLLSMSRSSLNISAKEIVSARDASGYYIPSNVYTPNNTPITSAALWHGTDFSESEKDYIDSTCLANYPGIEILAPPTMTYNCHAYAWHISQGNDNIWINDNTSDNTYLSPYWNDGSFIQTTSNDATQIIYFGDHSSMKSDAGKFISKWGNGPLVKHAPQNVPLLYGSVKAYYKRNFSISGPDAFCITGTYNISGITSGVNVNWSKSGPLSIISGLGTSSLTVSRTGDGLGYIYANLTRNGSNIGTVSALDIAVGNPSLALMAYPVDAYGNVEQWTAFNNANRFLVEDAVNNAYNYYEAYLYNSTGTQLWHGTYLSNGFGIPINMYAGWYQFKVKGYGDCGQSDWAEYFVPVVSGNGHGPFFSIEYKDTEEKVTIRITDLDENSMAASRSQDSNPVIIQLWNGTNLIKSYTTTQSIFTISLTGLKSSLYIVRVIKNGKKHSERFTKK